MLDLEWIRHHPHELDQALTQRGMSPLASEILELDRLARDQQTTLQRMQAERNEVAERIGQAKRAGEDTQALTARAHELKQMLPSYEDEAQQRAQKLHDLLATLPNFPDASVPEGENADHNVVVRQWGELPSWSFSPHPHEQVPAAASWLNFEKAAALSGSRFALIHGPLARLERALAQFMLDLHTEVFGYEEVSPPYLVREHALFHTGQLPKMREDLFQTTDNRWLIPTSEVSLANLVADSVLDEQDLPLRYVAYTPCFRAEAGAAGQDTRGLLRLHQFPKVELVSITLPDQSEQEHERMTAAAEEVLKRLELPYRVVVLCTGDMGFSARKTYDLEVWFPAQGCYREISSCSQCGDFQARRMRARYRPSQVLSSKLAYVHTLNGSGVAVGRALAAVIEHYQQADGSIVIPAVLQPYMKGSTVLHARS